MFPIKNAINNASYSLTWDAQNNSDILLVTTESGYLIVLRVFFLLNFSKL